MNDKFAINKTRIGNLSSLLVWFSNHLNLPKDFTTYYILPKILNSLSYVDDVPRYIFATRNKVTQEHAVEYHSSLSTSFLFFFERMMKCL